MNISGKTQIVVPSGEALVPSKGLTWGNVASANRAGKQVQAAVRAVKVATKS